MMFLQRGNCVKSSNMMKKRYATGEDFAGKSII